MKLITIICTLIGFAFGLAENIIVGNQIQSYKRQQRRKNRDKLIHRAVLQVYSLPAEHRTQALAELQVFMGCRYFEEEGTHWSLPPSDSEHREGVRLLDRVFEEWNQHLRREVHDAAQTYPEGTS